jgi:hypothetical protein
MERRIDIGNKVIESGRIKWARLYARKGIPNALRSRVWEMILETETLLDREKDVISITHKPSLLIPWTDEYCFLLFSKIYQYCKRLSNSIRKCDLLVDAILFQDLQKCLDDDTFFLFDEMLNKILLYWSRDPWLKPILAEDHRVVMFRNPMNCACAYEPAKAMSTSNLCWIDKGHLLLTLFSSSLSFQNTYCLSIKWDHAVLGSFILCYAAMLPLQGCRNGLLLFP